MPDTDIEATPPAQPWPLPRRDYLLLPLIFVLTIVVLSSPAERPRHG